MIPGERKNNFGGAMIDPARLRTLRNAERFNAELKSDANGEYVKLADVLRILYHAQWAERKVKSGAERAEDTKSERPHSVSGE